MHVVTYILVLRCVRGTVLTVLDLHNAVPGTIDGIICLVIHHPRVHVNSINIKSRLDIQFFYSVSGSFSHH